MKLIPRGSIALFILAAILLLARFIMVGLADWVTFNRLTIDTIRVTNQGGKLTDLETSLSEFGTRDCNAAWLLMQVGRLQDRQAVSVKAAEESLRCSDRYVPLLMLIYPDRIDLAKEAVNMYPSNSQSWFWLAGLNLPSNPEWAARLYSEGLQRNPYDSNGWLALENAIAQLDPAAALRTYHDFGLDELANSDRINHVEAIFIFARLLSKDSPEQAIKIYRQGLSLVPGDGVRWRELGDVLSAIDPIAAIDAYLKSCNLHDPGFNGCYLAGLTAEKMGDYQNAIRYYRLSRWSGSIENAIRLEKQLNPQPSR